MGMVVQFATQENLCNRRLWHQIVHKGAEPCVVFVTQTRLWWCYRLPEHAKFTEGSFLCTRTGGGKSTYKSGFLVRVCPYTLWRQNPQLCVDKWPGFPWLIKFTLIISWIGDYIHFSVWNEITYPFPKRHRLRRWSLGMYKWFNPSLIQYNFIHPCWDLS